MGATYSWVDHRMAPQGLEEWGAVVREHPPVPPPTPRLLDRVRAAIRIRHYSRRTEETYVAWIRRYVLFHYKRHPSEMGEREIPAFLSHLASVRRVSASTQNQALSALLFLCGNVLGRGTVSARSFRASAISPEYRAAAGLW